MLIEHCALVFSRAREMPKPADPSASKTQEILVPYYFASLMKHAEELNNGELLAKAREVQLIFYAADHAFNEMFASMPEILLVFAEGFASMADNEDFRTNWPTFFMKDDGSAGIDPDKKDRFVVHVNQRVVEPVLKAYPDKRRDLRPLLDLFKLLERA